MKYNRFFLVYITCVLLYFPHWDGIAKTGVKFWKCLTRSTIYHGTILIQKEIYWFPPVVFASKSLRDKKMIQQEATPLMVKYEGVTTNKDGNTDTDNNE